MDDLEKVIRGIQHEASSGRGKCGHYCSEKDTVSCEYDKDGTCILHWAADAIALLKSQETRVMTLEEVVAHYSLPPVFPDDLGMQFDYLNDIQPLYFDFPHPEDPWIVHWRKYDEVNKYLDYWKADYGKTWRCCTSRPTDEQREAAPWAE